MATIESLIGAWDLGYFELGEAFKEMPDADLWKRPHEKLLSVGEIAGHISYWEGNRMAKAAMTESPLSHDGFRYYTSQVGEPVALEMGVEALHKEMTRIHEAAKEAVLTHKDADPASQMPEGMLPMLGGAAWANTPGYMVFHIAYHTRQIYSARHLLGHEPVNN